MPFLRTRFQQRNSPSHQIAMYQLLFGGNFLGRLSRDVINVICDWHPRGCKTEKDLERSLHKHLEKNLPSSEVISQNASGRVKGDIAVDRVCFFNLRPGSLS